MAQEYGAAQPLFDWTQKYVAGPVLGAEKFLNRLPGPSRKVDTSWHDEMLKEANDSFAKQAVGKKAVSKRAKKRTAPLSKKRIPRKKVD